MRRSTPGADVNSIKTRLRDAVSTKNPAAIAAAVSLPPLVRANAATSAAAVGGGWNHSEVLKVDGGDWGNVLNPLLDAHAAIRTVSYATPWNH